MNKTKFFMYAAAFAALSGSMVSCSEDDVTGGDSLFDMKPLSVTLTTNGGDDTQTAAKPNRVHSIVTSDALKDYWTKDDVLFVWSKEENYLNKLTGAEDTNDKQRMKFSSQSCSYEDGKRMAMLYVGNQSLEVMDDAFTLRRGDNDNNLALVYGSGTNHYSDRTNPFILKVSSSTTSKGALNGSVAELTLKDAIAKLRIGLPAKDAYDAALLAKLKYVITVSYKQDDGNGGDAGTGFPSSANFTIKSLTKTNAANSYKIFSEDDYSLTWGDALTLTYEPNATAENAKSSALWNATDESSADYLKGYVYVPLPSGYYKELSVKVTVSNPDNVEGVADFCKDYSYTWNATDDASGTLVEVELNSTSTNQYYYLPDMWTRE